MARKVKPNFIQKFLHRFIMLKAVTAFLANKTHLIDGAIFKLTNGKHSLSEILGWNIIQINTIGAKTGRSHQIVLLALIDGEKIGVIASNFGRQHYPGWYYNLLKNPLCDVQLNGHWRKYTAREIHGQEYEKYWQMAVESYAGYQKYRERAAHRRIPLMILVPAG